MDKYHILTIVIPVYNRERLILKALNSLAIQSFYGNFKVIVVDDKSSDYTVEIVKAWIPNHPWIDVKLITTDVKGVSGARNCGLNEADTEYVMFFDSDDRMMPGFLDVLIDKLVKSQTDIIGWDVNFTGKGKHKRIFKSSNVWFNHLVHGALSTQRYVARTSLFNEAGGWNESLSAWTDLELGVRILLQNPKMEKLKLDYTRTINVNFTRLSITGSGYQEEPEKWINALDSVEDLILNHIPEKIGWIQYRRAILAAEFSRAQLNDLANQQLERAMNYYKLPDFCVKLIFNLHKKFKRGTWLLASCFSKNIL
ncbi:MAG: glycosyltransferase family 2 protein [Muribaculaceae bacterium]|nr:glycosyltransferase family 2 protein [Muribaculaceae bacterium]